MEGKHESTSPTKNDLLKAMKVTKENLGKSPHFIEGIVWPSQVMKVVLAYKAENRRQKQLPFYYQVVEYHEEPNGEMDPEKNRALILFVEFFKVNVTKLPSGLRFQLAVLLDGHWTTVDHEVTTKGIACFNLDSVMDKRALRFFRNYLVLLDNAKLLRSSYMYYVSVPQPPFGPTPKEKVENMIQTDFVSCGIFMADHLSFLSRTNVFHHLRAMVGESSFKMLGRSDVSPALSPIFRLTQSKRLIKKLSRQQINAPISRQHTEKTLKDLKVQLENGGVKYNVILKGDKILDDARNNLLKMTAEEIELIFDNNLIDRLIPYVKNYSPVVSRLIALIYTRISDCKDLADEKIIRIMAEIHQVVLQNDKDINKLLAINSLLLQNLKNNEVYTYRLLAASISFTALHIQDNNELWDFYEAIVVHSVNTGLNSHTNSFFNKPTKLTPALSVYIEKAVKLQLLINLVEALKQGDPSQLNSLTEKMKFFLNKARTFDVKTTKSATLLQQITASDADNKLEEVAKELKAGREGILQEFGFEKEASPSSDNPLKI